MCRSKEVSLLPHCQINMLQTVARHIQISILYKADVRKQVGNTKEALKIKPFKVSFDERVVA